MAKKYFENFRLDLAYNHFFKYLEKENGLPILEALEISSGENLPKSKMNSGPFPVYGGGGKTSETHSDFNFEFGTLGIGRVGARCGCVFEIVPNSWVTDNALVVIKWDQRFSLRFLKHYLAYLDLGQYANNAMQPVISKTRISHIQLPIISISEQEEIAKALDKIELGIKISEEENLELSSTLKVIDHWEKLISEIQSQKSLLSQLKQSILQEAIQGKLTEEWRALRQAQQAPLEPASELLKRIQAEKARLIKEKKIKKEKPLLPITDSEKPFELPEGWEWCRLGSVFQSTSGGTPSRNNSKYWGGVINWYKSGELNDGFLERPSQEKITDSGLNESSATLFPKGTLLIAMYGATAGKLSILGREACTNQAVCGFYENPFIKTEYLFHFLFANRAKMISESWGMSQPNISQTYLRDFVFALPPAEEQQAIVEKVESLMEKCRALEEEISQSEQHAQMLMQAVLKEAFETD